MWIFLGLVFLSSFSIAIILFYRKRLPLASTTRKPEPNPDSNPEVPVQPPPSSVPPVRQAWEYFLVLDVEATCLPGVDFTWPNEIIVQLRYIFFIVHLTSFNHISF